MKWAPRLFRAVLFPIRGNLGPQGALDNVWSYSLLSQLGGRGVPPWSSGQRSEMLPSCYTTWDSPPPPPPPQNDLVQMTTVSQVSHPGLRKAGKEGERSHLICLHVTVTGLRGKEAEGDLQGELALGSEEGATSASQERWIHGFSAAGEKSRAAPPPTCSARACSRDTLTEQKPQIKVPPDGRPRWQLGKVEKPWLWTRAPQGQRKLITNRSSWARAAEQRTTERLVQTPSLVNCLRSLGSL